MAIRGPTRGSLPRPGGQRGGQTFGFRAGGGQLAQSIAVRRGGDGVAEAAGGQRARVQRARIVVQNRERAGCGLRSRPRIARFEARPGQLRPRVGLIRLYRQRALGGFDRLGRVPGARLCVSRPQRDHEVSRLLGRRARQKWQGAGRARGRVVGA
jgi:hypothetical protein